MIVVDADKVLVEHVENACEFWNNVYGRNGRMARVEDFKKYDFKMVFGIGQEESRKFIRAHYEWEGFNNMRLVDGVREGLERLAKLDELVIATARAGYMTKKTLDYFSKELPGVFSDIYFCRMKGGLCRELGADIIVEDSVDSLKYAEEGIDVILFDKFWNQGIEHNNLHRRFDWDGIAGKAEELRDV